jgi:DNA-binding PadR family transcriptional regulator
VALQHRHDLMSANLPKNGGDGDAAADGLSSVFGAAAASSLRNVRRREEQAGHEDMYVDEPADGSTEFIESEPSEAQVPETRQGEVQRGRNSGESESTSALAGAQERAMRARMHPVQVRDRRLIHALLLAAAKGCPPDHKLIDVLCKNSDGVFVLSPGLVYRELHILERERLIDVSRDGRSRQYILTQAGERVLKLRQRQWEAYSHGFARLLEECDDDDPG